MLLEGFCWEEAFLIEALSTVDSIAFSMRSTNSF
jgi:hypothetical protein